MKEKPFGIDVEKIRAGKIAFDVDCSVEDLDLDEVEDFDFHGPVVGRLEYQATSSDILVFGKLRASATGQCIRCVGPAALQLEADVSLAFVPQESGEDISLDEEAEGAIVDYYSGDYFDPAEQLRELILLELPALPLCKADCKGLCVNCGQNLNLKQCGCAAPDDLEPEPNNWKAQLRNLRLDENNE